MILTDEELEWRREELRHKEADLAKRFEKPNSIVEMAKWGERLFGPLPRDDRDAGPSALFRPREEDLPAWERGDVLIGGGPARGVTVPGIRPAQAPHTALPGVGKPKPDAPPAMLPPSNEAELEPRGGRDATFVQGFISDDEEFKRYLAKLLYPGGEIGTSIKRIGKEKGYFVHRDPDDGQVYWALPGGPAYALSAVGHAIPVVAGGTMAFMTSPATATGIGSPVSLGAASATAAAGETIRQGLGNWMLGDAATPGLNEAQVGQAAALGLAGPWWTRFLTRQGVGPNAPTPRGTPQSTSPHKAPQRTR
jgi:hypothetical protein